MALEAGLSRATFAKLSPYPYLLANLDPSDKLAPKRSNARSPNEARDTIVKHGSLSHAQGSSLVRMGDTTVICGVRGETILTSNIPDYRYSNKETELQDYDLLVPNIELATGCAPQFLPGGPPSTLAQTLSTRIFSLLHSTKLINPEELRIWHTLPSDMPANDDDGDQSARNKQTSGEKQIVAYWVLYIDIFFISFDGNPFDAAWTSVLAALCDTKIPQARYDPDRELVVCSRNNPRSLTISELPVACTIAVFTGKETDRPADAKTWLLVDPDSLEESMCDESATVVLSRKDNTSKIFSVSKHGGGVMSPKLLLSKDFQQCLASRWTDVVAAVTNPES